MKFFTLGSTRTSSNNTSYSGAVLNPTALKTRNRFKIRSLLVLMIFGLAMLMPSMMNAQVPGTVEDAFNLPDKARCTSKDLAIVSASLDLDNCNCTEGDIIYATLVLGIDNNTESTRTSFAFWSRITLDDGDPTTPDIVYFIRGCQGPIPKGSLAPPNGVTLLDFDNLEVLSYNETTKDFDLVVDPANPQDLLHQIPYVCGSTLTLSNIYEGWTDASDNPTRQCPLESSTINPKCGVNPEIKVNVGLLASADYTDVKCYGGTDGSVKLTFSGGTAPYMVTFNGGTAAQSSPKTYTGLAAGTYNWSITDSSTPNACTKSGSTTIGQPAAALSSTETHVNVLCYGGATGSINLSPSGGTAPYAFAWTKVGDGTFSASTEDLLNLTAGTYDVVITDANGSTGGCRATKSVDITQPAAALSSSETHVNVLCYGNATGSIDLTPSGGTAPYAYAWTASSGGVIPAGQADDQDLSGLVAGTYDVVITDANGSTGGCRATKSVMITQPAAGLSSSETHVNVLCYGGATGSIDLTPSGGTAPYSYAWTASLGGVIPSGQASNQDLSGLVAGTYDVVITDANGSAGGCTATKKVVITQPAAALSSSETHVNVLCYGGATGSIDLTPSGGTAPYAYAWTASSGGIIPAGQADDQDLTGLVAGTYDVVITDANGSTGGCEATKKVVITQPAAALSSSETHVNVLCYGGATGSIDLTPSGGTAPYAYAWTASLGGVIPAGQASNQDLTGLVAGTYDVVITDANGTTGGCTATKKVVITQPAVALSGSAVPTAESCAFNDGSIALTVSGGTSPYTYLWNTSATTKDLSGLTAGSYSVTITDANGCEATASATVNAPTNCITDQGCTLGYWKNHTDQWACYSTCTLYISIFEKSTLDPTLTLQEALNLMGNTDGENLARQSVAALLNICSGDVGYSSEFATIALLQNYVNDAWDTTNPLTVNEAGSHLDLLNNAGCPLGGTKATTKPSSGCDAIPPKGKPASKASSTNAKGSGNITIDSSSKAEQFSAYPVPFKETLNIKYNFDYKSDVTIQIFDMRGQLMKTAKEANASKDKVTTLSVDFARGNQVYIVKVTTDRESFLKKIISKE